jgi:cytochrome c oxidase assembly protein subunit 15
MAAPHLSPRAYQRVTLVAAWSVAAIIVTGAAVRLSGSGLGCPDWPACDAGRLVAPVALHPMVEFVNRVVTGLVSLAVIAAVLGSLVRAPRRSDLTWLSVALVLGVMAQIVLGGVTVLTDLNPFAVQAHFVLSMAIMAAAVVLHRRAGEEGGAAPTVTPLARNVAWAVTLLTAIAVVTGTIVTGTGPHGGDEHAQRFGFAITAVVRVHSVTVWCTVALALVLAVVAHRRRTDWAAMVRPLTAFVWAAVLQGAVGYTQYFSGVPAALVAVHVAGAVAVWVAALHLVLTTRAAPSVEGGHGGHEALLGVDHLDQDAVEPDGVLQVGEILQP